VRARCRTLTTVPLVDGARLDLDGVAVEAIATPGHTSDGFCFTVHDDRVVLTGDTVLAWVNPVISHPDCNLSDMIASLGTIRDRLDHGWTILPGHWPGVVQARTFLGTRIATRHRRTAQVRALMALGLRTPQEITTALYDGILDARLIPAAELTVASIVHHVNLSDQKGIPVR
jgi:glyoxylase-like metal-dependent hydrolase (beta-lactamase superfamily II)